jgi:hypothetical protein
MALAAAGVLFRIIPVSPPGWPRSRSLDPSDAAAGQPAIILAAGHGGEDDGYDWGPLARTGGPSCSTW